MRFILVDEILELQPGLFIKATKTMSAEEEFFQDHFPGFPVVPGVLLTEMMAQAAGKCLDAEKNHPGKAMLGKIHAVHFRDWVRPDQEAIIQATINQNRPSFATATCAIQVHGKAVCSSKLFFVFVPHDKLADDYRDEVLERYLAKNAR